MYIKKNWKSMIFTSIFIKILILIILFPSDVSSAVAKWLSEIINSFNENLTIN